jgi:hypothetical protein
MSNAQKAELTRVITTKLIELGFTAQDARAIAWAEVVRRDALEKAPK